MRAYVLIAAGLLILLSWAMAPAGLANPPQTGTNGDCLDFNLLFLVAGVDSPNARIVAVEPGTVFDLTVATGYAHIEWRDADGRDLGANSMGTGEVHPHADYGIICVGLLGAHPEIPVPSAGWVYRDGL